MYYTVYKITNLVNGKVYIGQHRTTRLDDGYMGSGTVLKQSIKKHGKSNFKKEILYVFDNPQDMNDKEKELVHEEFVNNPNTYNLDIGGCAEDIGQWNVGRVSWNKGTTGLQKNPFKGVSNRYTEDQLKAIKDGTKAAMAKIPKDKKDAYYRNRESGQNKKWMNKNGKHCRVPIEKINEMEVNGWAVGRILPRDESGKIIKRKINGI